MTQTAVETYNVERLSMELVQPGRNLIFIDDGGTPGQPLGEFLVKDFKLHVAVTMPSEAYKDFLDVHREFLSNCPGVDEFHTVDVFQRRNAWGTKSKKFRRGKFNELVEIFDKFVRWAFFVYVGSEQYASIISQSREAGVPYPYNINWDSHSEGARIVMLKGILEQDNISPGAKPLVIVEDAEGQRHNVLEVMFQREANVLADAVFRVDSKAVPGIQLADLLAYCLNRKYHIHAKKEMGKHAGALDPDVQRFLQRINHKCASLI